MELDGTAIDDDAHLVNLVGLIEVGKKVSLEVFRDGKTMSSRWKSPTAASSGRDARVGVGDLRRGPVARDMGAVRCGQRALWRSDGQRSPPQNAEI